MPKKYPVVGGIVRREGNPEEAEKIPSQEELIEIGQWYWVKGWEKDKYNAPFLNEDNERLMCVVHVGSNFVKLTGPSERSTSSVRVHLDKFSEDCRREMSPEEYLYEKVSQCRERTKQLMLEVKEVTARLGVGQRAELESGRVEESALVAVSSQDDVNGYKEALIKAEKEKLPKLFEDIKKSNEMMSRWMSAEAIPMEAQAGLLHGVVGQIKDRIFNVEIYSGLTERVVQVRDGEPAGLTERLRVMQRRHYMDEECLVNYRHGGMDFNSIDSFDEWLAEDENMKRILPFERCMVAFKIRRVKKERSSSLDSHIKFWYERNDTKTFMYIRNGEQLFRMSSSLDFGEKIFPDTKEFDPDALMVDRTWSKLGEFISVHDYEIRCKDKKEADKWIEKDKKRWQKERREEGEDDNIFWYNAPYEWRRKAEFRPKNWERFNRESVYYDDMNKKLNDDLKEYNRISLVIQGLYDRSPVLHPHPPVRLWESEDFNRNLELIYDNDRALSPGDKPDIEAYISKCNESFKEGSLSIGQELIWLKKEAAKENAKRDRSWRSSDYRPETYAPYGNPGPGYIAKVEKLTRTGKATFKWERERQTDGWGRDGRYHTYGEPIPTKITVHVDELFCVDGYELGDYKQFFEDPRTRAEYLDWAPMLLAAEDYHAKRLKVGEPGVKPGTDTHLGDD